MNEAETRAEFIDPQLKAAGWGVVESTRILREYHITAGKIQTGGSRSKPVIADYVLVYKGRKLAVVEAKSDEQEVGEGVGQAKDYAAKLDLDTTFAANGKKIYQIDMVSGKEGLIASFPSPEQLWNRTFAFENKWRDTFNQVPFEDVGGTKASRYYQEIAVNKVMGAIADKKQRILLTLATGTGKTHIAFQIVWKLFETRWNLKRDGGRLPRILFLADRNILADQAYNAFSAFPEDALARIRPDQIRKKGGVPHNGSIFFTIFQTFMSGTDKEGKTTPYFGEYPADYFDFIVIDECHRGGANNEGNWRGILDYFAPAVQLGLTATPKRRDNVDTYQYFGEPVYSYSLVEGINDGFLTPFKIKRIKTTLDDYIYVPDDRVIEGEVEEGKVYKEADFNRTIEIEAREAKRVKIFMDQINQKEKALVFCANQGHAALVRDLINQVKKSGDPGYCVRVTADDGELGEQHLRDFQDNEKTIPTLLTTSQKLSTGVDARNIRNIVLMRQVNSMIEFKQIVGRGTRLFDGKEYFTIYDFVDAYHHFADPEWDGEPFKLEDVTETRGYEGPTIPQAPVAGDGVKKPVEKERKQKLRIKLRDGKEREIQFMVSTLFYSPDGKPISAEEFLQNLYGVLPKLFKNEGELRAIWSKPDTRKALLAKLADVGFGKDELATLQTLINAEKSDLFDVLEYVSYERAPITRESRVANAQALVFKGMDAKQKEFLEFVLSKYVESGVGELDQEKLPDLLTLKYHALGDAAVALGGVENIKAIFVSFQKHLYSEAAGV